MGLSRKELMKLEGQIRFGLCEGDCKGLSEVRGCASKCPLNQFLDLLCDLVDVAALAPLALEHLADSSAEPSLRAAAEVARRLMQDYAAEDDSMRRQADVFFRNVIGDVLGIDESDEDEESRLISVDVPLPFFIHMSKLGMAAPGRKFEVREHGMVGFDISSEVSDEEAKFRYLRDGEVKTAVVKIDCPGYSFLEKSKRDRKKAAEAVVEIGE